MPLASRPIVTQQIGRPIASPIVSNSPLQHNNVAPVLPGHGLPVIGRQNPVTPYVGNTPTNGGVVSTAPRPVAIYRSLVGGLFA